MLEQENVFLNGEADAWYERNRKTLANKSPDTDPIFNYLQKNKDSTAGKRVLEVGCANGYRLSWLKNKLGCQVFGFDPSKKAISEGAKEFKLNTPSELFPMGSGEEMWLTELRSRFQQESFDYIIFGHSLYLIPPRLLPQIVATSDYLLATNGSIVIFDFDSVSQRRRYHHAPNADVFSYKTDYAKLFDWLPYYRMVHKQVTEHDLSASKGNPQEDCALSVLRKISIENAYPQLVT